MFTREKHRGGRDRIEGKQGPILNQSERKPNDRKLGVTSVQDKTPKRHRKKYIEKAHENKIVRKLNADKNIHSLQKYREV